MPYYRYRDSIIKVKRYDDRSTFIMGVPIPEKMVLILRLGPGKFIGTENNCTCRDTNKQQWLCLYTNGIYPMKNKDHTGMRKKGWLS